MADLKDVVKSLKTIDDTLKEPVKKSASDVEREQEAARDAKRQVPTEKPPVAGASAARGKAGG